MFDHVVMILLTLFISLSAVSLSSPVAKADPPAQMLIWSGTQYLDSSVNVPVGTLLTVEAGTIVEMEWNVDIFVHGSIHVDGTHESPVTFKRATVEDSWGSIHVYSDSVGSYVRHARLIGAEYGVRGDGGTFLLENTTMNNCKYAIGAVSDAHITVNNGTIDDSRFYSVYGQGAEVIFRDTIVGDAGQKAMYLTGQGGTGCRITYIDGEYDFGSLNIQDADTEVYRCWTVDVDVVSGERGALEGAQVTFQRNNLVKEFEGLTDAGGEVDDIVLTEIMHRKVGPTTFNPFTLTVQKDGYQENQTQHNVNSERDIPVVLHPANAGPALVNDIDNYTTFQNAPDKRLCDLRDFFQDDATPDDELNYTINYNSDPGDVVIFVDEDYYLTINTTPNRLFNGVVSTKVRATDPEGASTLSNKLFITVTEVPLPPEIEEIPDLVLDEDAVMMTALYLYEYIDDPDSGYENLNIFISGNDHGEHVAVEVVGDVLRIVPEGDYNGNGMAEITASDGNFSASETFYVNVTPRNDAPELTISSPKFGETTLPAVNVSGKATDIDGDELSLIITSEGVEIMKVSVSGDFTVSLDLSDFEGEEVWLYLTANDGEEDSSPVQLKLSVMDTSGEDSDGDGIPDRNDDDDDNDGVPDGSDEFPTDPAASQDSDDDGHPDQWNDGKTESDSTTGLTLDEFPTNMNEWSDRDGDGTGDNSDDFSVDPAASVDSDGDGSPDEWNPGKNETDSIMGLSLDAFPHDPAASVDSDGDGYPDQWNDGKSAAESTTGLVIDRFPMDSQRFEDDGNNTDDDEPVGPQREKGSPGFEIPILVLALLLIIGFAGLRKRR